MKKPHFLLIICLFLMVDMTSFSFLSPILPDLIIARGMSLSLIGFIFSFYPLSYFFCSLYLGKNLYYFNKKKLLIYCQTLLIVANFLFATLNYFTCNSLLVLMSILSRLVQGLAIGGACSILYSYVPELYPREQEETFALIEMSVGAGVAIGPVVGGYIYKFMSYEWSFCIISLVYFVSSVIFLCFMRYDTYTTIEDCSFHSPTDVHTPLSPLYSADDLRSSCAMNSLEIDLIIEEEEMTYSKIFRNKTFLMTFFVYCISYTSIILIQPTFSDHIHSFGYDSDTVGMLFALSDLSYALTSVILIKLFKYFKRKHLFVFGGYLTAIGLLLTGPEELTFLPNDVNVICVGMAFFGLSQVFYNATIIPEFIDILIDIYGFRRGINEMGSGIYNAGMAFAEFCGPLLGGILADYLGFSRGLAVYAIFLCFYLLVYAVFIKRPPRILEMEKKMDSESKIEKEDILE